jgi:hypothetical protein
MPADIGDDAAADDSDDSDDSDDAGLDDGDADPDDDSGDDADDSDDGDDDSDDGDWTNDADAAADGIDTSAAMAGAQALSAPSPTDGRAAPDAAGQPPTAHEPLSRRTDRGAGPRPG